MEFFLKKILCITNMYPAEKQMKGIFIKELNDELENKKYNICVFNIDKYGNNFLKYLRAISYLFFIILKNNFNIIHLHFGLSFITMLPLMPIIFIKKIRLLTFFHGSDVLGESKIVRIISLLACIASYKSIAVSKEIKNKLISISPIKLKNKIFIIPCGINKSFFEINNTPKNYNIIFPSSPSRKEKNYKFFKIFHTIEKNYPNAKIVTLEDKNRSEIIQLFSNSKIMLLTSDREGSPQVFKEAMAINLPVVSRKVGDVVYASKFSPNAYVVDDNQFLETTLNVLKQQKPTPYDKTDLYKQLSIDMIANKIINLSISK